MKRNTRFTLGRKLLLMVLVMSLILCAAALAMSYRTYLRDTRALYGQQGQALAQELADQAQAEDMADGSALQQALSAVADQDGVSFAATVHPLEDGLEILLCAGDRREEHLLAPGDLWNPEGLEPATLEALLEDGQLEPVLWRDQALGWRMLAAAPVYQTGGAVSSYVVVELEMDQAMANEQSFLVSMGVLLACLAAVLIAAFMLVIRRIFIQPIRLLTKAAQDYEGGENQSPFTKVKIKSHDELRTLSDAFRMMLVEIDLNNFEQKELAVREQKLEIELQLANELNRSMLPKELPQREQGYEFDVHGLLCRGREVEYDFYDYFMLDQDRLCVVIGAVPGEGIPQALYTVMAQTAIKSQLRSGASLAASMTAANSQLHEMSSAFVLHALVGVLDGMTGKFSCINAGQEVPLLMRSQDRYEWVQAPPYAPLGQNENVVYQVLELELRQGDRMFFHTRALGEIRNERGKPFAEDQLRATLNLSQSRAQGVARQLAFVRDAAGAYSHQVQVDSYAMLALEYRRRDRAMAHCVLPAGQEGERRLLDFLQGQLGANGFTRQQIAEMAVLADELFILCCSQAESDARFLAQCAVTEETGTVLLQVKGPMGGRNPLERTRGEVSARAAAYIRKNTQRVTFEAMDGMDIITVTRQMEAGTSDRSGLKQQMRR